MSVNWIQKQKKQELIDLSNEIGYDLEDGLKKDEIVENLHDFLQLNASRLASNASLEGYYGAAVARSRTPHKPREETAISSDEPEVTEVKSVVRGRGRRATKIKQEPADDSDYPSPSAIARTAASALSDAVLSPFSHNAQASSSRTPAPTRRSARRKSELPASPADIADMAEYESQAIATRVADLYESFGVADNIEYLREACSSVPAVHLAFGGLEGVALFWELMPWKYAFDFPAVDALHTSSHAVRVPDLFTVFTGYWLKPALLWTLTSILVPLLFGYFFNLSARSGRAQTRKYTIDPLTFSVVKGLATWLVYCKGVDFFGAVNPLVAQRVDQAVLGGHTAVLIGSGITALASLYEASQKK